MFTAITAALLLGIVPPTIPTSLWYLPEGIGAAAEETVTTSNASLCAQECTTTLDCDNGLSCFHATKDSKGCCLKALKPNETGCVLDDQCRRACESTVCEKTNKGSRCVCEKGRHFLFNKCWTKCPQFAHPDPQIDERGFSRCALKTDLKTATNYMRRFRRQLKNAFC
ncbi:hypothetical protein Q1695_016201 [Nippostrongylus brasiliensis]|nr:hypothetical protein Q1695_016201 [Nippostrongylus brasiliensis]